jgi:acyl transferase domain-containing protein/acyl carrier protein
MTTKAESIRSGVAVVGMACRLPGAASVEEFWTNLCGAVESIRPLSEQELVEAGVEPEELENPRLVRAGALVEGIDQFDAGFFGINGREAEVMDPQHRLFLECAWEALEHAGYDPSRYDGAIGVFGGGIFGSYATRNLMPAGVFDEKSTVLQTILSNEKDYMTTRVAYKLNLRGPSFTVQSGCSTSLVAIHVACQNLLNFESDISLAGGVAIDPQRATGYHHFEGSVHSPDGHCRAFDAKAAGTVFGNGVGLVVLKRYEDAVGDGDTIYAVIRGSATNNDGAHKVGFTAPSVGGQSQVIVEALADAGVDADTIGYIEAHGTGTTLGDPIEVEAMTKAFRSHTSRREFCAIGSVKTNIGHLDAAAGVSGFIKTVLALDRRQLPPSLHFEQPNPKIDFHSSPFFVNTKLTDWNAGVRPGAPRRAGVSSFGMGGTNAHVVLEEAPSALEPAPARPHQLLLLSAKSEASLERATEQLAAHLRRAPDGNLADIAYTLQIGRSEFGWRRALVCSDAGEAAAVIGAHDPGRIASAQYGGERFRATFLFPGQGAQAVGMGRGLYESEPAFREQLDLCCMRLRSYLGFDLRDVLFPSEVSRAAAAERLTQTECAQPALFAVEYALARLWMRWGIEPTACLGHSIGEYVAACLAGVFSIDDALRVVAARGRLMQQLPAGAMAAVALSRDDLVRRLSGSLEIAALNAPSLSVIAGPFDEIEGFERDCREHGVTCRRLHTSHAFHSAAMDPILEPFRQVVASVERRIPSIPFVSNVTGTWIAPAQATDPAYWVAHLRQPVRFAEGVATILDRDASTLIEVGPGRALGSLARQVGAHGAVAVFASLPPHDEGRSEQACLLETVGGLWLRGAAIDWKAFYGSERRRRVALPTYPFERTRYWVDVPKEEPPPPPPDPLAKIEDLSQWFLVSGWRQTPPPQFYAQGRSVPTDASWLVFADDDAFSGDVVTALCRGTDPQRVTIVRPGTGYQQTDEREFTIDPRSRDCYRRLVEALGASDRLPDVVVHLWTVSGSAAPSADAAEAAQQSGFYSLVWLTQVLVERRQSSPERPLLIKVVTREMCDVTGAETLRPELATLLGPGRVIAQEHPGTHCTCIDIGPASEPAPIAEVVNELRALAPELLVAYRGRKRWALQYEPLSLQSDSAAAVPLRERGVYVIAGGFGAIGAALARHLAGEAHARLVLVGRSELPPRELWDRWLATHDAHDGTSARILVVRDLESRGAEVMPVMADVSDHAGMSAAIERVTAAFGNIDGVIDAAGVAGAGTIQDRQHDAGPSVLAAVQDLRPGEADHQFRPKMRGLFVLEDVLGDRPLDFCLIVSSLSCVLGGPGYATYSAANHFMDAFVRRHNRQHPVRWLSANFDAWSFGGNDSPLARVTMTEPEGVEVFRRLLAVPMLGNVVVSTASLLARASALTPSQAKRDEAEGTTADDGRARYARPASLASRFEAPQTPTEEAVAAIWQAVLGLDRVGRLDNFFELGGHSLLAVQVAARLEDTVHIEVPMRNVFDAANVADLAGRIEFALLARQEQTAIQDAEGADVEELEI